MDDAGGQRIGDIWDASSCSNHYDGSNSVGGKTDIWIDILLIIKEPYNNKNGCSYKHPDIKFGHGYKYNWGNDQTDKDSKTTGARNNAFVGVRGMISCFGIIHESESFSKIDDKRARRERDEHRKNKWCDYIHNLRILEIKFLLI